jgi:SAM-dependent methyltransferase
MIPLRIGDPAAFAAVRTTLLGAEYTEAAVCARLGIGKLTQFDLDRERRSSRPPAADAEARGVDPLDAMIRLFLEGDTLPLKQTGEVLPLEQFLALGLVAIDDDQVSSTVLLHPMRGLYIVSDRPNPRSAESAGPPPDDFVYPALIPNTDLFLDLIEPGPCEAFLDLCAGTDIAALLAAHAYACDITERSTTFAEFNRLLNGLTNISALQGDLYQPAGSLTFDRIVAHPPYVPVYRPNLIFDSGGPDGEQIVRRIVQGLPGRLRPGGRFYALTMGSDRAQPFERRLREWLGPEEADFDVIFVNRTTRSPRDWAAESVIRARGAVEDITNWRAFFENLKVSVLVYGLVIVQRRTGNRPVFTLRRQTSARTGPLEHRWLLDWETAAAERGLEWMLTARPRAVPGIELQVKHRFDAGNWAPYEYRLETDHPFNTELRAQAWTAYLFTCADGSRTAAELLDKMKAEGALHPDTPGAEFADLLGALVSGGFLQV